MRITPEASASIDARVACLTNSLAEGVSPSLTTSHVGGPRAAPQAPKTGANLLVRRF